MNLSSPLWHSLRQTTCRAYPRSAPALFLFARRQSTATAAAPTKPKPLLTGFLLDPKVLNGALLTQAYDASKDPVAAAAGPRIVPVCATWFMPNDARKRTGLASFRTVRIPGARFLDIDTVCDKTSPYPHMLPDAAQFSAALSKLGLRADDWVVCYDDHEAGIFSAPRAAWMFKVFGHQHVHVLNNFKLWVDHGFPVEKEEPIPAVEETVYPVPTLDKSKVMYHDDLVKIAQTPEKEKLGLTVIDARSRERWQGVEPEPRKGKFNYHGACKSN
jgi:thiosulfate/3-mercaptopyruvate sulfurtransferase